jgi:hypothetical protein
VRFLTLFFVGPLANISEELTSVKARVAMAKSKHRKAVAGKRDRQSKRAVALAERLPGKHEWIAQPKARRLFGDPSAVTWWRWRQKPEFPKPRVINGRLYFLWGALSDWWASQPDHAAA